MDTRVCRECGKYFSEVNGYGSHLVQNICSSTCYQAWIPKFYEAREKELLEKNWPKAHVQTCVKCKSEVYGDDNVTGFIRFSDDGVPMFYCDQCHIVSGVASISEMNCDEYRQLRALEDAAYQGPHLMPSTLRYFNPPLTMISHIEPGSVSFDSNPSGYLGVVPHQQMPKGPKLVRVPGPDDKDEALPDDDDDRTECTICKDNRSVCAFLPCGHVCVCCACARVLGKDKKRGTVECPMCRSRGVKAIQRVFM